MTLGTMAVDHELRIDFDKLRRERLEKSRKQMKADGLGALGLVDGIERALFLADKGSQCFFLFDHRHGNAPPDAFKI